MYAYIKIPDFNEKVHAEPVKTTENYSVYRITGDPENGGINLDDKSKGIISGKYMELAITIDKTLYIYHKEKLIVNLGPCSFEKEINKLNKAI